MIKSENMNCHFPDQCVKFTRIYTHHIMHPAGLELMRRNRKQVIYYARPKLLSKQKQMSVQFLDLLQ